MSGRATRVLSSRAGSASRAARFCIRGCLAAMPSGAAFAFLTCNPNPLVAAVHPKAMSVILHDEGFDDRLNGPWDEVRALACAHPSQLTRPIHEPA